jgi:hypothetical protein
LKDQIVLITGAGGNGGAMIDAISQHPRLGRSVQNDAPRDPLAAT